MSVTKWQENVAKRVRQLVLKHYYGQPNEFDFELGCSDYYARCSWWGLSFDNGLFDNASIQVLVTSFPEDSWNYLNKSVEIQVVLSNKFRSNISRKELDSIRSLVLQQREGGLISWKAEEEDGVVSLKLSDEKSNFGGDDDEIAELMLELMIVEMLKISDCYFKIAKNML